MSDKLKDANNATFNFLQFDILKLKIRMSMQFYNFVHIYSSLPMNDSTHSHSEGREWFIHWMSQKGALTFNKRHYAIYGDSLPVKTWESFYRTPSGLQKRQFYQDVAVADESCDNNRCECILTTFPFSLPYNSEKQGRGQFILDGEFEQFLKPWSDSDRLWYKTRCPKTRDGISKFCHDCRNGIDSYYTCHDETYWDLLQSVKTE
jgi:hypothetical protein